MRRRLAVVLAAALFATGCSSAPRAIPLSRDFRVPVSLDEGRGTFLFDTGASLTVIRDTTAASWRLAAGETRALSGTDSVGASLDLSRRALEAQGHTQVVVTSSSGPGIGLSGTSGDATWHLAREVRLGSASVQDLVLGDAADGHGLLGTDVPGSIVWVFDGPGGRLLIRNAR